MKIYLIDAIKLAYTVKHMDDADALRLAINDLFEMPTVEAHKLRKGATFTELDINGRPTKHEYVVEDYGPCRTEANNCHLVVKAVGRKGSQQWCIAREQKVGV